MAGSNQSSNLTGMLSQIGGTLGSMGSTYTPSLVRNIENVSRPDIKPGDAEGMLNMADWQNRMGRTDAAAVTANLLKNQQTLDTAAATDEAGATWLGQVNEAAQRVQMEQQAGATTAGLSNALRDYQNVYAAAPGNVAASVRTQASKINDNVVKPAQEGAAATQNTKSVASVRRMDEEIARLESSPNNEQAFRQLGGLRQARERTLNMPGVRDAYTAQKEGELKMMKAAGDVEHSQAVQMGSAAITQAFATGGIEAAAEAAAANPLAGAVFESLKGVHDLRKDLELEVATVESNAVLGTRVEEAINSLPNNIPEAQKQPFRTALETMQKNSEITPKTAQDAMLNLLTSVRTLGTQVTLQAQADAASASREREGRLTSLETGTPELTALKLAAKKMGLDFGQKLTYMYQGKTQPDENFELIMQVARDQALGPDMPRRFKYDKEGFIQRDKTGSPLRNDNYDMERAAYIQAPDTSPIDPTTNKGIVEGLYN